MMPKVPRSSPQFSRPRHLQQASETRTEDERTGSMRALPTITTNEMDRALWALAQEAADPTSQECGRNPRALAEDFRGVP